MSDKNNHQKYSDSNLDLQSISRVDNENCPDLFKSANLLCGETATLVNELNQNSKEDTAMSKSKFIHSLNFQKDKSFEISNPSSVIKRIFVIIRIREFIGGIWTKYNKSKELKNEQY